METPGGTGAFALTAYMPSNGFPQEGSTHVTYGRVFLIEVTAEYRFILLKIWEEMFETNSVIPQLVM